jgi:N,N'-diacetylbacillosaminyl-diphospho-undecaprenol alpha-1,3-N-acetylgalactosaminyltransferase
MIRIIHSIHSPGSARSFVMPIVAHLNKCGIESELWVENSVRNDLLIHTTNVPTSFLDSDLTLNPILFFARVRHYIKKLELNQPLVLHTHQTRASLIPLLASCFSRISVRIYNNHGLPYLGYSGGMRLFLWLLEWINMRLATHILFVSQSNLEAAVADRLLPRAKAHILGAGTAVGIDLNEYAFGDFSKHARLSARHCLGISPDSFVLAYVGRPVKRKGLHFLLKSWQRTELSKHGGILLIAGCTAAECRQALGSPIHGVRALGYVTDLKPFYAASDVLTLPSRHEGFPYSLLEAAAAGLPLIGTDIPGIRCAIKSNETGLLVPFNDQVELSKAILKLASDASLREYFGRNARSRVEEEFARPITLNALVKFYHQYCPRLFSSTVLPQVVASID